MGVVLTDTATKIPPDARGAVLVTGSHGGAYVGYLACKAGVGALIVHDAGIGREEAGIASLADGERAGLAAAAVSHETARIGDAGDMLARGRLSRMNALAIALGCTPGMPCADAAALLERAIAPANAGNEYAEARRVARHNRAGLRVVCVDSVSLVEAGDAGHIVCSGSHGGVVASQPHLAIRVQAAAALFNDAGGGIDDAGWGRLPLLDERGVAGVTVSAASARIGDGRLTLDDGVVSRANETAAAMGIEVGMRARDAVDLVPRPAARG